MANICSKDQEINAIETQYYRGTVRIAISQTRFDHSRVDAQRTVSEKNVSRLLQIFKLEGCLRLDAENHVCAIIDEKSLTRALSDSHLTLETILQRHDDGSFPFLNIHEPIECLYGQHRIQAGKKFLDDNDQWWTVKLFDSGLKRKAARKLVEEDKNSQPFSDGEIFQKIRYYHHRQDEQAEKKWWARLTESKRKDLRQLLRNPRFVEALDKLLAFPGLWPPIRLGALHRFLTLGCDEEINFCLTDIFTFWSEIVGPDVPKSAVDYQTVLGLETLVPAISTNDHQRVQTMFSSRGLFCTILDETVRSSLLRRLLTVKRLIPSLRTFFNNLIYLEPCCVIMKRLIGPKQKRSIRESLAASYQRPSRLFIEHEKNRRHWQSGVSPDFDRRLAYRQLWLYAFRHFPEMVPYAPKKEPGEDRPQVKEPNPVLWHGLGRLAVRLGFRTQSALELQSRDPDEQSALQLVRDKKSALTSANDPLVRSIYRLLKTAQVETKPVEAPLYTCSGAGEPYERRFGRTHVRSHYEDRDTMYISHVYREGGPVRNDITSFFVKQDIFHSFWGKEEASVYLKLQQEDGQPGDAPMDDAPMDDAPMDDAPTGDAPTSGSTPPTRVDGLPNCQIFEHEDIVNRNRVLEEALEASINRRLVLERSLLDTNEESERLRQQNRELTDRNRVLEGSEQLRQKNSEETDQKYVQSLSKANEEYKQLSQTNAEVIEQNHVLKKSLSKATEDYKQLSQTNAEVIEQNHVLNKSLSEANEDYKQLSQTNAKVVEKYRDLKQLRHRYKDAERWLSGGTEKMKQPSQENGDGRNRVLEQPLSVAKEKAKQRTLTQQSKAQESLEPPRVRGPTETPNHTNHSYACGVGDEIGRQPSTSSLQKG
ncbi:MAG: hypothetical protein M4579_006344 [Chaenotheca gracillima]|nr:MAG: hypothetical protein M4579_006344 [Chaenotheca gracillima]